MMDAVKDRAHRTQHFFASTVWQTKLEALPPRRALRYKVARIAYCTFEGLFVGDTLPVRAAALTYYTVLSLVPLLAFVFALLKGFGAYNALVEESIRPYLLRTFEGNPQLQRAFDEILGFVQETGVASLGFVGLAVLLYAATRLLRNIEGALNEIWGVPSGRGPVQQITDYTAIIAVTPICLLLAAALTTTTQAIGVVDFVERVLGIGQVLEWLLGALGPFAIVFLGLIVLYTIMPNTGVRVRSALIGAAVGGALWYAVLILHVRFQIGVARYNALYAGFAALPIFLVWVYVSWLTVLVGAQVASTHQNDAKWVQRRRAAQADQAYREVLGVSVMLRIGRSFLQDEAHPSLQGLSEALKAPEPLLAEVLDQLVHAGMVVRAQPGTNPRFVLGRDPARIHVKQILDALRHSPQRIRDPEALRDTAADRRVAQLLARMDEEQETSAHNRSLRALLGEAEA